MIDVSIIPLVVGLLVWFGVAFVTRTWARQWLAAALAGLSFAWWRHGAMREVTDTLGAEPLSFVLIGGISVVGMLLLATAGMGVRRLFRARRAAD